MTEKIPITSDEQKMAQEVTEITEEEILAKATGGLDVIKPIAGKTCRWYQPSTNQYTEYLPFGLKRRRDSPPPTLNPDLNSAFKKHIPDLNAEAISNEAPPAKRIKIKMH